MTRSRARSIKAGTQSGARSATLPAAGPSDNVDPCAGDEAARSGPQRGATAPVLAIEHTQDRTSRVRGPGRLISRISGRGVRLLFSRITRAAEWLRNSPTGMICLALATGVGAGIGAIIFRYLVLWFTQLFSGHQDYSAAGRSANGVVGYRGGRVG